MKHLSLVNMLDLTEKRIRDPEFRILDMVNWPEEPYINFIKYMSEYINAISVNIDDKKY